MINKIKKIVNMVKNDLGYRNSNTNEKVLFHKVIFHSYEEAINALKSRNLAPGEMAVARYYIGYDDSTIPPSWSYIRMVLAIGGATPNSNEDVYFFKDFTNNGDETISFDDLREELSNYYTKDELKELLGDDAWRELVNQRLENIDNDIDKLREDIKGISNIPDFNLNDYYTKEEVDKKIENINIPDTTGFLDEEDLKEINKSIDSKADDSKVDALAQEVAQKADTSRVENVEGMLENKVDSSFVEEYFETNVENTVNQIIEDTNIPKMVTDAIDLQDIEGKVSNAVDAKLENFEGVTTETIYEALQNNEYFTTNVIAPIETITEQVKTIETQIKNLEADIDGGEEEWILE